MSLRPRTPALVSFLLALGAGALSAQDAPLLLEATAGVAIPFGDFDSGDGTAEGTSPGASLSVAFVVPRWERVALYAGFGQHRFGCQEQPLCDSDERFIATGFNVGLRIDPIGEGRVVPWIGLGSITTRVEIDLGAQEPDAPVYSGVSELGFGGEAGLGLLVGLGRSLAWTASATVSGVSTKLPGGDTLALRYVTAHTGLSFLF